MKFIKPALFFLLTSLFLLSACTEEVVYKDDALTNIPADVNSITAFNPEKLMAKADFENFKQQEFFQNILKKARKNNPALAEIMENPKKSGIDLARNFYFNFQLSPEDMKEGFVYGMASINDKAAFEAMLAKADVGEIESSENCKLTLEKENVVIAWNDQTVLIGKSNIYKGDSKAWAKKVFSTTKETSVANNKNLQDNINQSHDIVAWNNSTGLAKNPGLVLMAGMINIEENDLKDNFIYSYLDFEKGAMVGKSSFNLKKGLTKDFDLLVKDKVRTDFSPFLPGSDIAFLTTAALDLRGLNQVLSEQPMGKSMIDRQLKEYGTNLNELTKVLQGDFVLATYSPEETQVDKSIFAAPIADVDLLQKVLDIGVSYEFIEKIDDYYLIKSKRLNTMLPQKGNLSIRSTPGKILIKDKMLFITSNELLLDQLRKGTLAEADRINKDQWNNLSNNIFGTFVDFNIMQKLSKKMGDVNFEDMQITSNRKEANFKMNMKDKEINSLKSMLQKLNEMYKKDQLKVKFDPTEEDNKSI